MDQFLIFCYKFVELNKFTHYSVLHLSTITKRLRHICRLAIRKNYLAVCLFKLFPRSFIWLADIKIYSYNFMLTFWFNKLHHHHLRWRLLAIKIWLLVSVYLFTLARTKIRWFCRRFLEYLKIYAVISLHCNTVRRIENIFWT